MCAFQIPYVASARVVLFSWFVRRAAMDVYELSESDSGAAQPAAMAWRVHCSHLAASPFGTPFSFFHPRGGTRRNTMGAAARVASVADGRFGPKRALTGSARATFAKQPQSCRASARHCRVFKASCFSPCCCVPAVPAPRLRPPDAVRDKSSHYLLSSCASTPHTDRHATGAGRTLEKCMRYDSAASVGPMGGDALQLAVNVLAR